MSSTNGLSEEGATVPRFIDHKIFLKSVILLGVIVSLFAILAAENLLAHIIESDRSMLSIVILLIYTVASLHWLYLSRIYLYNGLLWIVGISSVRTLLLVRLF